jgi:pyruvate dehydrogenase E2 component (dihydrolipoyllysine-residue acetyltransferase)
MAEIVMPRLSDTMEEGTILRWLKADGEQVARGEELVEIETDKATMIYESDQAGALQIVAAEGATLAVGEVIARVGVTAGDSDEGPASGGPASERPRADTPPASVTATAAAPSDAQPNGAGVNAGERIKASPLARRIAGESGIDLREITGSGPGGRIVKADVLAPAAGAVAPAASGESAPGAGTGGDAGAGGEAVTTAKGETTTVELSRTQQTIARRMAESKATIPDFTLLIDVDMEECVRLRAELKQISRGDSDKAPTYNDMVVKASALALREHPAANGSYRDGRLQLHSRVNVGVAVAAENALVVPTVFDADEKSLGEIARETHTLADRVRTGTVTPPELGGGTFTVSNLGMYGVRSFTAIINPPQAGILSVGALSPRAVVREQQVVARNTLTLTLACDHRILYGAEAAQFLARIRELLERPSALTL